jgi:hypothetical protein
MDYGYGASTEISIGLGLAICMFLGLITPLKAEELETTQIWRIVYVFPIVFHLISFLINLLVLTNDTVNHHVEKGEIEIAE